MNVLFVCLGNICRSPMAAGILKHQFAERSLIGTIESAGTADWNVGRPADPRAVAIAIEHGVDISCHRARQVRQDDFARFDLIFAMDQDNLKMLRRVAPREHKSQIHLLSGDADIADPYHADNAAFARAYKIIAQCCMNIVERQSDASRLKGR